jgi:DNA-binding NarL/FixJ family response regulator
METSVRVLVANGPRLFRESLVSAFSKHAGIKIVGSAENDKEVLALVAETRPTHLLIALDESRRRPLLCDELLPKFPGLRIIVVAPNTNIAIFCWASLKIHSKKIADGKNALLEAMRDSASRMKEKRSPERDFIPSSR